MKQLVQKKQEAVKLRKLGYSYKEIVEKLSVAKSSLSGWFRHIELTDDEIGLLQLKIKERMDVGRIQSSLKNRERRLIRVENIEKIANSEFQRFIADAFFSVGVSLYWAEGSKKTTSFQFINSDPKMLLLMLLWCEKYLGIARQNLDIRLFIHHVYAQEKCEEFWSKACKLPLENFKKTIYKPTAHLFKKNPDYKGCLRISIHQIDILRKIMIWQKLMVGYYASYSLHP